MSGLAAAAWALGAYVLGSVSFAYAIVRWKRGVDLRTVGSGNLGATNAGRYLGRRWGLLVYLLDFGKGLGPVVVARAVEGEAAVYGTPVTLPMAVGAAAFLGHCFPVFLGLRGGKGVATASGAVLGLAWLPTLVAAATFGVVVLVTRMVAAGSCLAAVVLPCAYVAVEGPALFDDPSRTALFGLLAALAVLILVRHRGNLRRIVRGEERRIGEPVE